MTYREACITTALHCNNPYAKAYAKAGIDMTGHEAYVQALYILNNITHWRGELAREVRTTLKSMKESQS